MSLWSLKNRMLELSTSGSVGGAVGNHCFYPAADSAFGALLYHGFFAFVRSDRIVTSGGSVGASR